jgi:hypothetical protein
MREAEHDQAPRGDLGTKGACEAGTLNGHLADQGQVSRRIDDDIALPARHAAARRERRGPSARSPGRKKAIRLQIVGDVEYSPPHEGGLGIWEFEATEL